MVGRPGRSAADPASQLMRTDYQIEFRMDYDLEKVARDWQALERSACASFFLSWTWMSTWLESLAAPPILACVSSAGRIVAMGFVARADARRHLVVTSRQIHLHQSGNPDLDRITTEFNGLLVQAGHEDTVVPLFLRSLGSLAPAWDECVLPGVPEGFAAFGMHAGYRVVEDHRAADFFIDLRDMGPQDLTARLSHNGRSQLRRALKLAAADGPLALDAAVTPSEGLDYFEKLKSLDRRRENGAFAGPAREAFHRRLIAKGMPSGQVELLRARAGAKVIGYLYQFVHLGRVLAYQASYAAPADNRHRPGLVMHYLAIERAKRSDRSVYDFLAGESRYKRALGQPGPVLLWLRLQQPRSRFALEGAARQIKSAINAMMPQACAPRRGPLCPPPA